MNRDDDQELWDLLGKSQPQTLSPFFARNVVRQVRQEPNWRERAFGWLPLRRAIPALAAAVVICAATFFTLSNEQPPTVAEEEVPEVVAKLDVEDYEVVADLDTLLALQEDDSWDDTSTL